jgi:hypothetical protein
MARFLPPQYCSTALGGGTRICRIGQDTLDFQTVIPYSFDILKILTNPVNLRFTSESATKRRREQ